MKDWVSVLTTVLVFLAGILAGIFTAAYPEKAKAFAHCILHPFRSLRSALVRPDRTKEASTQTPPACDSSGMATESD